MAMIEAVVAGYTFVSVMLVMVADEKCEPDDPCYIGKRYGEKGWVTICRVSFVITFLPFIFLLFLIAESLPERERAKEWLFEEREGT